MSVLLEFIGMLHGMDEEAQDFSFISLGRSEVRETDWLCGEPEITSPSLLSNNQIKRSNISL